MLQDSQQDGQPYGQNAYDAEKEAKEETTAPSAAQNGDGAVTEEASPGDTDDDQSTGGDSTTNAPSSDDAPAGADETTADETDSGQEDPGTPAV